MTSKLSKKTSENLIEWFNKEKREMPWRNNRTPYRVWISELMLQQTKVEQAIPYFNKWMKYFPTLLSLSKSSEEEVLKLWQGIGYYSRARNIYKTSKIIKDKYKGHFPANPNDIESLPGIGPYTKAAICSLAYNLDYGVLDGNVIRVLSRFFAYSDNVGKLSSKKELQSIVDLSLPKGKSSEFNEAIMELGALVCTPKKTKCNACPINNNCKAFKKDLVEIYPIKTPKKKVPLINVGAAVIIKNNKILISQRRSGQMLEGLWEFPGGKKEDDENIQECIKREIKEELNLDVFVDNHLITINHSYSHFKMRLFTYFVKIIKGSPKSMENQNFEWISFNKIRNRPFSKADLKIIDALSNHM